MDRKTSDKIVALVIATVLVGGGVLTWQATQRRQTNHMGSMMDGSTAMGGTDPTVYAVGTILAVALLVGFYAIVRSDVDERTGTTPPAADGLQADTPLTTTEVDGTTATAPANDPPSTSAETTRAATGGEQAVTGESKQTGDQPGRNQDTDQSTQNLTGGQPTRDQTSDEQSNDDSDDPTQIRQILDLLPDDERRILQPVVESPGLTQIALRDRSNFSKSKVSQTVSELEKRGLLYREKQGRTYRIYPDDDLADQVES